MLEKLTPRQLVVLQISVLVVALCGIVYELIIATVSSYLLGDSVYQFSITIGLFMFAMGVGSYVTKLVTRDLVRAFVLVEVAISLIGGCSSILLFVVFPYTALYKPVMVVLILVIGGLVGVEIPLLTRILSQSTRLEKSIAHVLSLDYIGALIGSVAFPLLLLPSLGLFRASFSIGLINLLVAGLNVAVFARLLPRPRALAAGMAGVGLVLVASVAGATRIRSFAEDQLFADPVVWWQQTPYQRLVLTRDDRQGKHRLYIDGHIQFAEADEYRYHEALVHPLMSLPGPREWLLVLGGGDGLAARELLKYDEVEHVDIVDLDPSVTRLCSTYPPIRALNGDALHDARVTVHNEDAFTYVRESGQRYHRVVIDLPDPHNEALNKLYSKEFYQLIRRRLAPGGYLVTQSTSPFFTREVFWGIAGTLRAAGYDTHSYQIVVPSFGLWGFTLAARDGRVPTEFRITEASRFLDDRVMAQASVFPKDVGPVTVPVNSVFEPTLYPLYRRGRVDSGGEGNVGAQ